ncbi:MAG: glucokinase [Eubacteriales bacterium]|nr:glucokinase [Eubacteriales bacterium]
MILAADIGGTKALFAFYERENSLWQRVYLRKYASKKFNSLEDLIRTFLSDYTSEYNGGPCIDAACFALAATITDEGLYMSNLGWRSGIAGLKQAFPEISTIQLCNDLEATGYGLELLPAADLHQLNQKGKGIVPAADSLLIDKPPLKKRETDAVVQSKKETRRAIIAPGTGLGEAFLLDTKAIASEGGHCEFGPRSEMEVKLWRFLHEKYGHVSYERILSGSGLSQLERFVRNEERNEEVDFQRLPEDITHLALSGQCPVCMQALDYFVDILGAEAGNLALKFLAVDGIYLAGGIPPKILKKLKDNSFLHSFCMKGRYADMMKSIPVFVVLNPNTALYGAARLAAKAVHPGIEFTYHIYKED